MSVLEMLLQLLLEPLTILLETIYGAAFDLIGSYGAAIIPLSLAVNFLLLPFYKRAEVLQAEERAIQTKMMTGIKHIKSTFKGDERYMMLQAYYRLNHYKPIYSLRSLLPLILEIPFFIAAYRFLSSLDVFDGNSYGFIFHNLGQPDQLLLICGVRVNVLPILMTIINVISSEVYTHGAPLKEKLTLHSMAIIFLLLLYNSPSALVFYWTLNNIFSLIKNLITKSSNPLYYRNLTCSLIGITILGLAVVGSVTQYKINTDIIVLFLIALLFLVPLLTSLDRTRSICSKLTKHISQNDNYVFYISSIFLTLLTGLLIPTATIASSPSEFMLGSNPQSPLIYTLSSLLLATGSFIIWTGLFYYLSNQPIKTIFTTCYLILSGIGIFNYLFFGKNLPTLLPMLQYETVPKVLHKEILINNATIILITIPLIVLLYKKRDSLKKALVLGCVVLLCLSVFNIVQIQKESAIEINSLSQQSKENHFVLSTKGKNIIIVMVDRAISGYIPYLFSEKPELRQQFDGFTWYPNTLSYSNSTNTATPAVYGGYDYRPAQMNARNSIPLVDKHNEALKTMPVIFSEAGFDVTVCDPPWAGYSYTPNLSIFNNYPRIHKFNTESGKIRNNEQGDREKQKIWKRNFFYFSFMKILPLILQRFFYHNGTYFDGRSLGSYSYLIQIRHGLSKANGIRENFLDAYSALNSYPEFTQIAQSETNTFTMLYNSTAHNYTLLKEPNYTPEFTIDNTDYDNNHKDRFIIAGRSVRMENEIEVMSYQSNMAALLKLGIWFDDLREKDVYNNTRIIIVADHGAVLGSFSDLLFGEKDYEDAMAYNPLLMVKDFDSTNFKIDNTFMTNADTPTIAFKDVISNPINPFTNLPINNDAKKEKIHYVFYNTNWNVTTNHGNVFTPGIWLTLSSDNIFDMSSWKTIGKYEGN